MLSLKGISHHYENGGGDARLPSVHGISLEVKKGMVTSLLGPSGCGKSTLLRIAAGLEAPDAGEVWIDGACVASVEKNIHIAPEARRIGLVFQDYALFPHMTVAENIRYGLDGMAAEGMTAHDKDTRLAEVLGQVDMAEYRDAFPHMLSGGQQQRVALARALAPKPKLMLLDEPYAGLDSRLKENIRDDMLHVLRGAGATVLMVTHDSEEAMFMSDEIHLMRAGRIEQGGRPIDLYCRPRSAFVAEFFGEVNRVDGPVVDGKLQTPFGDFPVESKGRNGRAALVIRHEGLRIGDGDAAGAPKAEVMEARVLGRYSLVHLSMPDTNHGAHGGAHGKGGGGKGAGDAGTLHLHARVPGLNMLKAGEVVSLTVDKAQVFVFSG